MNNTFFFKPQKTEKKFLRSQMRSELQSHNVSSRRCSHERGVQQERFVQNLEYWKAQLRGQLQNEKLIMTSLKQSFQETSENERQAVMSTQQLASSLQSEMSEATTACDSRRRDRLTMEVTEQKRRRQLGGTPRMTHLLICHHQEETVRNASGRQKIHSPYHPLRAAEVRVNTFHRLLLLYRTCDQLPMKRQKMKRSR